MKAQGLYDPAFEHDACGVAFVARLDAPPSHEVVDARARRAREPGAPRRGRRGRRHGRRRRDPGPVPDALFCARRARRCRPPGATASPSASCRRARRRGSSSSSCSRRPSRPRASVCSAGATSRSIRTRRASTRAALRARASASSSSAPRDGLDQDAFERKLYVIRRVAEHAAGADLVIPSFSSRTLVYKGMLTPPQLRALLPRPARRARRERARARALALLDEHVPELGARAPVPHDRPQRRDQHAARQRQLDPRARVAARLASSSATTSRRCCRSSGPAGSDTAVFDNVLELLVLAGRSLPHALMMMVPEAYRGRADVSDELRGFYAFHECLTEAWDGPAAIAFTDGPRDRRDARPQRAAARPLARDARRLGRARLRGGRARHPGAEDVRAQGPAAAGQALPRRSRRRAASSPTTR